MYSNFAISLLLYVVHGDQYVGSPDLNVWPLPQNFSTGWDIATLVPSQFAFLNMGDISPIDTRILDDALKRYLTLTFEPHEDNRTAYLQDLYDSQRALKPHVPPVRKIALKLLGLRVTVTTYSSPLVIGVDESYSLSVPGSQGCANPCFRWASLNATTVWGALRGLETFSQLVNYERVSKEMAYVVSVAPVLIQDWPRFPWRGLMIDSSRHFLSMASLKASVDGMMYNKLNVLHWHITDAESFPFRSTSRPKLNAGSYSPNAQYSAQDIKSLVDYARSRGVIVIPETDTPGHTASWGVGYPEILTPCWDWLRQKGPFYWPQFDSMALDVTKNFTFDVIADVVTELQSLFGAPFYHIGGDEVIAGCWNSSANITQWMRENGYATQDNSSSPWVYDFVGLQHMWTLKMIDLLASMNATAIVWDEALSATHPISNDTIIHIWNGVAQLKQALELGYRAVMSYGYYLDKQAPVGPGPACENIHWMWMWTWHDFYQSDPLGWFDVPEDQKHLVLGGEMASFGESVADHNVEERIWGRGPAVAERFWSDAKVTDITDAQQRLGRFWCRMQGRGIRTAPTMPGFCGTFLSTDEPTKETNSIIAKNALIVLGVLSAVLAVTTILLLFDRCRKKQKDIRESIIRESTDEPLHYKLNR